ncbi:ATPase [Limosilactobacillus frumenti DSM 13145]|uniref:ATPase n=1 Tax=Limosilactobacillus frumenti DSM 13145 TaxID=1423746 RepID=A0A0R1P607_9LACO|nr:ATP-binding protein [Limosilactobacillus frumenti]KRL28014.1 ATPase [Limosilactobacillus frumenti DSM 13145]
MGPFATMSSGKPWSGKATDLVKRHLLVVGQTGSGKTTTTLSLLNQLQKANYTTIIFDPTGEYAQLPNAVTYRLGDNAYLEAGQLSSDQLQEALDLPLNDELIAKVRSAVTALRIQENITQQKTVYRKLGVAIDQYERQAAKLGSWSRSFASAHLAQQLIEEFIVPYSDDRADYHLLGQQYDRPTINHLWGAITAIQAELSSERFRALFDPDPHPGVFKTELNFVIKMFLTHQTSHRTLVIDLSALKQFESSQRTVISLLLKNLLNSRLQGKASFPVNIVIDEAHRYLPTDEQQLADNGIFQVLREGRKVNLSMTLTTQSPLDLPARLRSQFAHLLIHHLASADEMTSLAHGHHFSLEQLMNLTTGQALLVLPHQENQLINVNLPDWFRA